MNNNNYYSVRMHASAGEEHVSGAERIVSSDQIEPVVLNLIGRARNKKFHPDQIRISIDNLAQAQLKTLSALDVTTLDISDPDRARYIAGQILIETGVSSVAVKLGLEYLSRGAAPSGSNMRGAIIMNAETGKRLEPDPHRGIRASRFDWTEDSRRSMHNQLVAQGLHHYRVHEALALATKVAYGPGVVSELCWSDDPDYTAGYVSSRKRGYVRFPHLKKTGDSKGGRVVFINASQVQLSELINYLQTEPVLIETNSFRITRTEPEKYFDRL